MSLFTPLALRSVTLRNRIGMSPMCQYSAVDGRVGDWHVVHYGARAVGGVGLVIVEAAGVEARGRISAADVGIWEDGQVEPLARVVRVVAENGAAPGIQLAHAGRKASVRAPWDQGGAPRLPGDGGWTPVAPSALPFADNHATPEPLDEAGIAGVVTRLRRRGPPGARGRLPGGRDPRRPRLPPPRVPLPALEPPHRPVRRLAGEPHPDRPRGGGGGPPGVARPPAPLPAGLVHRLDRGRLGPAPRPSSWPGRCGPLGVDVVDCSSGGNVATARIPAGPGYQVPFAEVVRRDAAVATAAVGMITSPAQAETVIRSGQADLVLLARELLRDPHFPLRAARELGVDGPWPRQYLRAK